MWDGAARRLPLLAAAAAGVVIVSAFWVPASSVDEAATILVIRQPWSRVLDVFQYDAALEPYYVLMKLWSAVSTATWWLRVPSLLAAVAVVVLVVLLVRAATDAATAALAALAMLILPAVSRFGQDARPYALVMLASVLAVLAWSRHVSSGTLRTGAYYVATLCLTGLLQAYSLTIVGALIVAAAARLPGERKQALTRTVAGASVAAVVLSPFLWYVSHHAHGDPRAPKISPRALVEIGAETPVQRADASLVVVLLAALTVVTAFGLLAGLSNSGPLRDLTVLCAAWLLIPPLALTAFQGLTDRPGLVARYWAFCLPAVAILMAIGLRRLCTASVPVFLAVLALLVAACVPTQAAMRGVDGHGGQHWIALADILDEPALSSLPLVSSGTTRRGLAVYAPDTVVDRMPLIDATKGNPLDPPRHGRSSAAYRRLVSDEKALMVYRRRFNKSGVPTARSLRDAPAAGTFRAAYLRCNFYGDVLAVLAKPAEVGTLPRPAAMEAAIKKHAAAGEVTCVRG